jgi:hypothetical protein
VNELPALGTIACDWVDGCPGEPHKLIRVWDIPPSWKPRSLSEYCLSNARFEIILACGFWSSDVAGMCYE